MKIRTEIKTKTPFLIFLILILTLNTMGCGGSKALRVHNGWALPASAGDNGAVYFTVDNPVSHADTLLGASSDIAQNVEMHASMMGANNTMTMQMQESVPVPAGGKVEFKPGGLHVMLVNLNKDLKAGDNFPLTLDFQNAGNIHLDVQVKNP